ncbi:MAG: hypothetical protein ACYSXF_02810 [Planctomycetota bacterium]|jgi:1,2-phenylacetyl-CoA epoxidase PaaB subunit
MSKLREQVDPINGDIQSPPEGDLKPYVIFTQLAPNGPHIYAGWLDAADDAMALQFAREHYGQDQECVNIWAIPRSTIAATEPEYPASTQEGPSRTFQIFVQQQRGGQHVSAGTVDATSAEQALRAAVAQAAEQRPHSVWVVPRPHIASTDESDIIWRLTDQTYRLARGYAGEVRTKWEKIRAERDLEQYERDDLKDAF